MSYYNTVPIQGDLLAQAHRIAGQQDQAVLAIFQDGKPHTPSDVWQRLVNGGRNLLLTSVRRSVTTLEHAGALVKLDEVRMGPHGRPERLWSKA